MACTDVSVDAKLGTDKHGEGLHTYDALCFASAEEAGSGSQESVGTTQWASHVHESSKLQSKPYARPDACNAFDGTPFSNL